MQMRTLLTLTFVVMTAAGGVAASGSDFEFQHHFIDRTLPVRDNSIGDYGLTALVDLDHDGDLDFVLGGRPFKPSQLYWFEYQGPDTWVRHLVGTNYLSDVGLAVLDVDGDGWPDLVCSGVWFRNPGHPRAHPFERIVFDDHAAGAHDILVADIDGDGKPDIVMMGDERTSLHSLCWFSIPSDPRKPWVRHYIGPPVHGAITLCGVADLNGDGHLDVIRADTWFENKDGKGLEWTAHHNIPMGRKGPFGVCVRTAVADLDGDGKPEIVMADADITDSKVVVLKNADGKGGSWTKAELPRSFTYGSLHSLAVADFNGDGKPDIVANEQEELLPAGREDPRWVLWENRGGGRFVEHIILDSKLGGHELQVGDVDGDGDLDICSKAWGTRPWNGNDGGMHVDFLENLLKSPHREANAPSLKETELAGQILADQTLREVHQMAKSLLAGRFNAGSGYGEVWIRDLNTFIEVALEVNPADRLRDALLPFFKFQGTNGDIVDGYIPLDQAKVAYAYRTSALAPNLMAHKNTVETDQESSLVQAVRKYVAGSGDRSILEEQIAGQTVRERLGRALRYVLTERFDRAHGLVWGATTVDWGDVQPESPWGVELDADSHRALDIYDNAMLVIAINDYLELLGAEAPEASRWKATRDALKRSIRLHLWDAKREKFIPHIYLAGSPFPKDFDENAIYYHGGTAVAIEAGLLTPDEVVRSLDQMVANVRAAGAASIGLTVYPPYPEGFFKNPQMRSPYSYQNGGDWSWFGGRMIQALIRRGHVAEAYRELRPMVERVRRTGGFHEWWSRDNQPRGSGEFRGAAGVLGRAIELLEAWAEQHEARRSQQQQRQ